MSNDAEIDPEMRRWERHPETDAVLRLVLACPPGETVTYEDCGRAAGLPSDSPKLRGIVSRCARWAERRKGFVFEAVANVGRRRRTNSENAVKTGPEHRKKIVRATRTAKRRLLAVNLDELKSDEERAQWNGSMIVASALDHIMSAKTVKKVLVEIDEKARFSLATDGLLERLKKK